MSAKLAVLGMVFFSLLVAGADGPTKDTEDVPYAERPGGYKIDPRTQLPPSPPPQAKPPGQQPQPHGQLQEPPRQPPQPLSTLKGKPKAQTEEPRGKAEVVEPVPVVEFDLGNAAENTRQIETFAEDAAFFSVQSARYTLQVRGLEKASKKPADNPQAIIQETEDVIELRKKLDVYFDEVQGLDDALQAFIAPVAKVTDSKEGWGKLSPQAQALAENAVRLALGTTHLVDEVELLYERVVRVEDVLVGRALALLDSESLGNTDEERLGDLLAIRQQPLPGYLPEEVPPGELGPEEGEDGPLAGKDPREEYLEGLYTWYEAYVLRLELYAGQFTELEAEWKTIAQLKRTRPDTTLLAKDAEALAKLLFELSKRAKQLSVFADQMWEQEEVAKTKSEDVRVLASDSKTIVLEISDLLKKTSTLWHDIKVGEGNSKVDLPRQNPQFRKASDVKTAGIGRFSSSSFVN